MMTATSRIIISVLACSLLTNAGASAKNAELPPPDAVPAGALAPTAAIEFRVNPLEFKVEPYEPAPEMAPTPRPPVKTTGTGARGQTVVAAAVPGGSAPPQSVPANARLNIQPFVVPVAAISFANEATIADVAVKKEGHELHFTLAADVLFNFDRAELRPEAGVALRKFRDQLGPQAARARMRIEGHTDGKGSDAYNDRLAEQRAQSVQQWLQTSGGIASSATTVSSFGKRRPVAQNTKPDGSDDPDGRQRNRRVEIVVTPL